MKALLWRANDTRECGGSPQLSRCDRLTCLVTYRARRAAAAGGGRSASGARRADRRRLVVLPRSGTAVLLSVQARADPGRSLRDLAAGAPPEIASHRRASDCRRVPGARRGPARIDRPPLERSLRSRARFRGVAQGWRCRPLAQCFRRGARRLSTRARQAGRDAAVARTRCERAEAAAGHEPDDRRNPRVHLARSGRNQCAGSRPRGKDRQSRPSRRTDIWFMAGGARRGQPSFRDGLGRSIARCRTAGRRHVHARSGDLRPVGDPTLHWRSTGGRGPFRPR